LLHGITGSGKTEIYIDLINKVMESGQQVLFLLPEIAITTQMISRLYKAFGNSFGVYHSKYSDNERVEIWNGVLDESIRFVVGVRSSIFLPFQNLGLIIVDEEHETSYKQHQPSPRYHARDVALVLSRLHQCSIILGTATPSTESYFNAEKGKFDLIELNTRYGEAQLPEFKIIDIKTERQKKKTKGEFANLLLELLKSNLENNYQSILFQNRRGYSPILNCDDCGWTAKCVQCSVSLTYHQYKKELKCHYCGYSEPIPTTCPDCGSNKIKTVGFGTQKLEEDLSLLLPEAKIARMDLDTTRSKSSYDQIISNFENNEIDILIGTQIVTKGLDFGKVNLVGIVDFDRMINYPDFRSFERAFQLSVQVSGRAGRRDIPGKVIIQTRKPGTEIINYIQKNDWKGFYNDELLERKNYHYPPFTRLVKISVKHKFAETASKAAFHLTELLRERLNSTFLLGPEPGVISKIRNLYIYDILLKFYRNDADLQEKKNVIIDIENSIKANRNYTGVRINNDVDPG
ncbi:MAG: primosomal protein N', partial [Cyclobacteriaceae bacterium]|nr:primosomal protein N' [Cyclobacteriaceae bacterium]